MSEATQANDGAYFIPQPLSVQSAHNIDDPVIRGKCIRCAAVIWRHYALAEFDELKFTLSCQCGQCGHKNVVVQGSTDVFKCEPSSNPEPTSPTSLAIAAGPSF
jgi:DNA-directed RNA polymerase subunit RPC12/RpoP